MTAHCYFGCMHTAIKYGQECCIDWPGWLICLEHEAIDVDDKVVGQSEFPTFFLACWLVDCLHVTLNRKLGFFRYALIIGPLTSSFLRLHISYTRVTIRAPLGRGFRASWSVAIKIHLQYFAIINCLLSLRNGHLSKLHVKQLHFYLRMQK